MKEPAVFIASMGVICGAGPDPAQTLDALKKGCRHLGPLTLFEAGPDGPLPVSEVFAVANNAFLPRTHQLARLAADQALAGYGQAPEAIVLGGTTGGMPTTENELRKSCRDPGAYRYHALNSVAEDLADRYGCTGPVITLSTACASGATAIAVAMEMVRSGMVKTVLAGGADGLCRLTYFGFKSLQLIDPAGARPLDADRRGMSIGEGAAMLLLTAEGDVSHHLRILGAGLSCDAHHPTAPHPQGAGALAAMRSALQDAGIAADQIDYINLHGTGTPDNDRAEAAAVNALFDDRPPLVSSTKGIMGHTLAASGAIEAVIAALAITHHFIPPNVGWAHADPLVNLKPVVSAVQVPIRTVLSNSLGFGGNNATLIIGKASPQDNGRPMAKVRPLVVCGYACLSGAGRTSETLAAFANHTSCQGCLPDEAVCTDLPPRAIRRLKRLPKIAMALAQELRATPGQKCVPQVISIGTGWGALSETHDFITRMFESDGQFPSPMDFIGSVHNSAAGQLAMLFEAQGANLTATGGNYSFEQALWCADLATRRTGQTLLVVGADEGHALLSPLLDASAATQPTLSDGGGAIGLRRTEASEGIALTPHFFHSHRHPNPIEALIQCLGGSSQLNLSFGAVLAGIPAAERSLGQPQLARFIELSRFGGPVVDFRELTGEFATATALAAVAGIDAVAHNRLGAPDSPGAQIALDGKGVLLLGLGRFMTAIGIGPI